MIKINLLNNELAAPPSRKDDLLEDTSEILLQSVARKSKRSFIRFLILFLVIGVGGLSVWVFKIELLNFAEKFTGPLPILEKERRGDKDKELELLRSQIEYVKNQHWKQARNFSFLNNFNQVAFSFPKLALASIELLDHDFLVRVLNNSRFEVTKFTKKMEKIQEIDSLYSINTVPEYKNRKYKLATEVLGQLKSDAVKDSTTSFKFSSVAKADKALFAFLEKNKLKVTDTAAFAPKRVIMFNKTKKEIKFEGSLNSFMQFFLDFTSEYLPIEIIKLKIEVQPLKRKQRRRNNKYDLQYNLLEPIKISTTPGS